MKYCIKQKIRDFEGISYFTKKINRNTYKINNKIKRTSSLNETYNLCSHME